MIEVLKLFTKVLDDMGYDIEKINIVSNDYVELELYLGGDSRKYYFNIGTNDDDGGTVLIDYGFNLLENKGYHQISSIKFKRDNAILNEVMIGMFKVTHFMKKKDTFYAVPQGAIGRSYFFNKRCNRCATVYYSKEITKEVFETFDGNDNIITIGDIRTNRYVGEIKSCCSHCLHN